ncbi:hypothetical protein CYMTET_30963 [Cymbomonas tetramitiformis]|uniref:Uncharacterized protein n=1 Tax=Cymbomonas tetramitiformis TaxID=36881 RepID=A0AAE0FHY7_9CHLO|nr:hypothetical protein CYMTET_30963 [Cymbomonas tetramitiformis]
MIPLPFAREQSVEESKPRRRDFASASVLLASSLALSFAANADENAQPEFKRLRRTQFIAALGDPDSSSGAAADEWGLWPLDPGPRGVYLRDYRSLESRGGKAPAKWQFDRKDWWLEEHGLIMEKPDFPLAPGKYIVTGGREVSSILTVYPDARWELSNGAKLYDVTHLPCRAARYTPMSDAASPANARLTDFPVKPGAEMPTVEGHQKQDYAVLFVIGVEA